MYHRPQVDLICEKVELFAPNCTCGWKGIKVVKYFEDLSNLLNSTEKFIAGGYSAATIQLRQHVKDFSDDKNLRKLRSV